MTGWSLGTRLLYHLYQLTAQLIQCSSSFSTKEQVLLILYNVSPMIYPTYGIWKVSLYVTLVCKAFAKEEGVNAFLFEQPPVRLVCSVVENLPS